MRIPNVEIFLLGVIKRLHQAELRPTRPDHISKHQFRTVLAQKRKRTVLDLAPVPDRAPSSGLSREVPVYDLSSRFILHEGDIFKPVRVTNLVSI